MAETPEIQPLNVSEIESNFLVQLTDWIQQIEALRDTLQQQQPINAASAKHLQFLAHRLTGASAALDYYQISQAAHDLEELLQEYRSFTLDQSIQALEDHLSTLRTAIKLRQRQPVESQVAQSIKTIQSLQETRSGQLIYLVEDDPVQARELASQIGYFGYSVHILSQLKELEPALHDAAPAAILMDLIFPEGETAGADAILSLREQAPDILHLPVIFVSVHDDLPARLHAVRAGGEAYFTKPVDIGSLIDMLDRLTTHEDPIPYRIMVIDDSAIQARVNAMHLKKAGMQTEIITEPSAVLRTLNEFNPDLILLDMYMPECAGMELARIIRQIETFVSIPIVYLSAETDREKQLEAVGLGGDDFLTKPIKPAHLIASITSRVERYRQLRTLMLRDSLTGLFNHTTTRERLNQEMARAARHKTSLTYAMLDLDDFKRINDTYGHAAGDRVLKSLAQMLVKRLRRSDIIGRYGGEEFAIILPNTIGSDAVTLMDDMRQGFSQIRHHAGDIEFTVTFSCGIATYPENATPASLSEAADQALYVAKHQGKNLVIFTK